MSDATAAMARQITQLGSKQTYHTARLLVDRDLVDDFYRGYAYFRWADDIVDDPARADSERIAFIKRQRDLIDRLYRQEQPRDMLPQEEILACLIQNDRRENGGLESFIRNMFAIVEFDAYRKGRLIGEQELEWYSDRLSRSVTDGLLYFVGNGHPYVLAPERYLAAWAAHITHLLRDMYQDIADGFINIPREYIAAHGLDLEQLDSPAVRDWVRQRVKRARDYFERGKQYLSRIDVLRCKIAGYWYCARFESVLDMVEVEQYRLRPEYHERRNLAAWLRIAWLGITIATNHVFRR
ncbi:MAG: squalene/phytoene synthase family protein [Anaerolineae bacterium]|nr:squalene/phytoene synthase family protein [Anaerolineae bacterium]